MEHRLLALVALPAVFFGGFSCERAAQPNASATQVTAAAVAPAAAREPPPPFQANIITAARENAFFRRVMFTGQRTQLVVMSIPPGTDIGEEIHPHVEQLFFVASGTGKAIVNGKTTRLAPGDALVVLPDSRHDIVNDGSEPLKIYTIYAPPSHLDGRVHKTKQEAEADKADEAFGSGVR